MRRKAVKKTWGLMELFLWLDLILCSFVGLLTGSDIIPWFTYPALMLCLLPILYVQVNFVKKRQQKTDGILIESGDETHPDAIEVEETTLK